MADEIVVQTKRCNKCGEVKDVVAFSNDRHKEDGKSTVCKSCVNAYQRELRGTDKRKTQMKVWQDRYWSKNKDRINARNSERQRKKSRDRRTERLFAETGMYEVPSGSQQCCGCRKIKSLDEFYKRTPNKKNGRLFRSRCKPCEKTLRTPKMRRWAKNYNLTTKFGITVEDYESLLAKQDHRCAICGRQHGDDSMKHGLAVDHDHQTGKVRGLLCRHCNIGIGKLGDSVEALTKALNYLKKASASSDTTTL